MPLIDKQKAKEFASTFFADPILKMAANALLENAPTVEAAPVVHGHWKPHHMVPGFVVCSACCDCITYDDWPSGEKWKYCPHCGAKLDAKEADHGGE